MIQIIIGLLIALGLAVVAIFGLKNKNAILNLINTNSKVIDQVKDLANQETQNNGALAVEEQKRQDLQSDIAKTQQEINSQAEILRFFNKDKK